MHGLKLEEKDQDGKAQPLKRGPRASTAQAGQKGRAKAGSGSSSGRAERHAHRRRPVTDTSQSPYPSTPASAQCSDRVRTSATTSSVDEAVREAIAGLGGLDVLINFAGLATPQSAGLPPDAKAVGGGHLASPGTDCRASCPAPIFGRPNRR